MSQPTHLRSLVQAPILGALFLLAGSGVSEAFTISNVIISPRDHGLTATWTTDQPSNTSVSYTVASGGGGFSFLGDSTTSHLMMLSGLDPQTAYQVTVTSTTSTGAIASAGPFTIVTLADTTSPEVSGVQVVGTTSHAIVVQWDSSEAGSGFIDYGPDLNYGQTIQAQHTTSTGNGVQHLAVVGGLNPLTTHSFRVRASDVSNNVSVPVGNFTASTESLWTQAIFQPQPVLYGQTCVVAGDASGCTSDVRYQWPKEMSWTGNEVLVQFNASADDVTRGLLAFDMHVGYMAQVGGEWVQLEVAAGTNPSNLVVVNPGGVTLDHTGHYSIAIQPNLFTPGLNYLRLRAINIDASEIGYGHVAPTAVWDRMQLRFAGLQPASLTDEQLLDRTESQAARYLWEQSFNSNGFVRDVVNAPQASTAATGFGLAALVVMADRFGSSPEWTVTPTQAQARAQQILDAVVAIQQQQTSDPGSYGKAGFLYHFIGPDSRRYGTSEVSTVDTALFLAGALTTGQYFGGTVQERANQVMAGLNWDYFFDKIPGPFFQMFYHAWKPAAGGDFTVVPSDGEGFLSRTQWDRPTDEVLLINLLALARDPANVGFRQSLYAWPRVVRSYSGYDVVNSFFGSLFTYEFAHSFFDFQAMGTDNPSSVGSTSPAVDWFANAKNAVLANRQFVIDQSLNFLTYTPEQWGLSACFRPDGTYFDHNGAPPAESGPVYDGTVPPYGAISAIPLVRAASNETLSSNIAFTSLQHLYLTHFSGLWGPYGPRDSLRTELQNGQPVTSYSPLYVGIDVGPEALMIENYRTKLITRTFMSHPTIRQAIQLQFPSAVFADALTGQVQLMDGTPLPAVEIKLSGRSTAGRSLRLTALTGAQGTYTFANLPSGSYRLKPHLRRYRFTPRSLNLTWPVEAPTLIIGMPCCSGVGIPEAGLRYISGVLTHGGGLPFNGVELRLSGRTSDGHAISLTVLSGPDGRYTFEHLSNNGTYAIIPQSVGSTFTPSRRTVVLNGSDVSGVDFTATP